MLKIPSIKLRPQFFIVLFIFIHGAAISQSSLPLISVIGNKLVNSNGNHLVLKGLNTSDADRLDNIGQWNSKYFDELKLWGAKLIRFPVHPQAWTKRGPMEYCKLLDKGIALATERGMYVIIDWHSIGNLKSELFQSENYYTTKKQTLDFWNMMAARYGKNNTVAFFELFNEPTLQHGQLGICSWQEWKAINEEIIAIIRSHGSNSIPLVAGFDWAYDLSEVRKNPIDAENIAYVSHPYPQKKEKPWIEKWDKDWGFVAEKYPVILTEVGYCEPGEIGEHIPVISDSSYVDEILNYCNVKGISFCVWVFDASWAPRLIEDWNYKPSKAGLVWKSKLQY